MIQRERALAEAVELEEKEREVGGRGEELRRAGGQAGGRGCITLGLTRVGGRAGSRPPDGWVARWGAGGVYRQTACGTQWLCGS